ncbi:hypothetical protein KCP69_09830 [Salmonella enterica subsp. enterica]|nr:hypothetical protein KCP69_09830 [Salmonella enterica subsp. enterica]
MTLSHATLHSKITARCAGFAPAQLFRRALMIIAHAVPNNGQAVIQF